jgi:hypothetical protein
VGVTKMESHQKGFFEVEVFFPSQNINIPLFKETLGVFLSLPLFFCSVS